MARITLKKIYSMKEKHVGIACLTAYDASFAKYIDNCGIDIILVGDSLGVVVKGYENTHNVTQSDIEYHTKAVSRGNKNAYLISDMPINTYNTPKKALMNAKKLIKECGAQMVKLETDPTHIKTIELLSQNKIPVCAHIGIRPQRIISNSEYKKQGKTITSKNEILHEAILVEKSGAKLLIVECIDERLAYTISNNLSIPVIGIASGKKCDGQILVLYDLLGVSYSGIPKFVDKKFFKIESFNKRIKSFIKKTKKKSRT